MNVLDENVPEPQADLLRSWRIAVRHLTFDLGNNGMSDEDLVRLLHGLRQPTFFTQDQDFCKRNLRHAGYCLVWLHVRDDQTAEYIRRTLRHPDCNTKAKRMGTVIEVSPGGLLVWRLGVQTPVHYPWPSKRRK